MKVDHLSPDEDRADRRLRYSKTAKDDLERLTVSAIKEHRRLFESDQTVYDEWERVSDEPTASPAVVQSLQEEYLRRRTKTAAQQELLADLIDALGYVPDVPLD
jgi:hypothetical protein